jgi:hypothetical protein
VLVTHVGLATVTGFGLTDPDPGLSMAGLATGFGLVEPHPSGLAIAASGLATAASRLATAAANTGVLFPSWQIS